MNHGFKLHPDGTLEITMPKGKKVTRVLVCEAGTQNGSLYYPDGVETGITRCKDCKFAHMTHNGECKYCDIWFPDEKNYLNGNYYCASAERKHG